MESSTDHSRSTSSQILGELFLKIKKIQTFYIVGRKTIERSGGGKAKALAIGINSK